MTVVHFIINPIAGKGDPHFDHALLASYFEEDRYDLVIKTSNYPGHATQLAHESVGEGAQIIVACGGDGTINEVASCLVHTSVLLGIIPMGSGNGLAESLNISRNLTQAAEVIRNGKSNRIDVAMVNGKAFFSNMGIGFDAHVISNYNASEKRRFWTYLKAILKGIWEYDHKEKIKVEMNGERFRTRPFMFFVSNSKIMGYDISLTRMASMQDGLLDVVVIDRLNRAEMLLLGLFLVLRMNQYPKKIRHYKAKEVRLSFEDRHQGHVMQTDGELHDLNGGELHINIQERALRVLIP